MNNQPASLVDLNNYKLLGSKKTDRENKLHNAGFVRLKPQEDACTEEGREVYRVDFIDKDALAAKKEVSHKARLSLEKKKDLDESTSFNMVRKRKEYGADLCLGYKITPFAEILFGRGLVVERKEDSVYETRDDGWRMKFKVNF